MALTHSQKKYLKKNIKRFSPLEIAQNLNLSEKEILDFLKSHWRKEKYQNFLKKQQSEKRKSLQPFIPFDFNLKKWLAKNWKILLFLSFLVLAVYANSLGNDFLSDDIGAIKENPDISNTSYFLKSSFSINPRNLIIFLTNKLFGLNPLFYHLTNVLFHLGSVWVIFILISFFFKPPIPFFTAGIFAIHPILTESVTWISGGPYSNGAFFGFLTVLLYLLFSQKRGKKFYLFSLLSFIIAFLFSEKLIILPIILLLYEFCFGQFKKNWRRLIPFFIFSFLFALKLLGSLGGRVSSLEKTYYQQPGLDNPLIQIPIAVSSYLNLIFWPKGLTLYHSELTFSQGQYFLKLGIFLLFLGLIIFFFKKEKRIFFWLSFFLISLFVTLSPLRISWVVAERYVYFGSLGIFVFIAWLISQTSRWFKNQKIAWIILALIIVALSTRTIIRNFDWKNQDNLWVATAKTSPSSHQNHNNLGDMYVRHGDYQKAIEEFQKAIELKPNYGDAYHNLANVYHQTGRDDLAEENYQKALFFNPNLWQSYQNLAAIYFNQEKFDLSKEELEKAIKINPENTELHTNLGIVYLNLNDKQKAQEEFQKALQIDPQNQKAKQLLLSF